MFSFEKPLFLIGIPVIFLGAYFLKKHSLKIKAEKAILISNFNLLEESFKNKSSNYLFYLLPSLQILSLIFLCLALSEPCLWLDQLSKTKQVILAIDISHSMSATDLSPNRLISAKEACKNFINNAPNELKIGLELFNKNAILSLQPTSNRQILLNTLEKINSKMLGNGTSMGEAILLASKTIDKGDLILFTDGENNSGIDPIEALNEVKNLKIYTIGIGDTLGGITEDGLITKMREEILQDIAYITGGTYSEIWAGSAQLEKVYESLSSNYILQKVQIQFSPYLLFCTLFTMIFAYILSWTKFHF